VVAKTVRKERMMENMALFDFALTDEVLERVCVVYVRVYVCMYAHTNTHTHTHTCTYIHTYIERVLFALAPTMRYSFNSLPFILWYLVNLQHTLPHTLPHN
jgi:hypothetical protein